MNSNIDTSALEAELNTLVSRIMSNPSIKYGEAFRERQVELFDFGWAKRDPEGYAARQAECAELRRKQFEAGAESDKDFARINEIQLLLS